MTPTVRPKRIWKSGNIAIWTVLSAVVVFILVSLISDLETLKTALSGFPLRFLVPVGLLSVGNYFLRYVKWHWYMKLLDHRIDRFPNLLVFLSGFALTVTPGKVGEFIKAYIVKERFNVPYTASTAVLLMERFTDVAALVLLSCLGLFLSFLAWWVAVLALLAFFAFLMLVRNRSLAGWVIDQTARFRLLKRFSEPLKTFYQEGWILLDMGIFLPSLLLSLGAWFLEGLGYAIVAWGLGSAITLMEGVFIYSVALLGGGLTLFLGGLGATEGGMVGLGIFFGMSRSTAAASTIIVRVMTLWFAVLIGWGVFLFTPGLRSLLKAARTDELELTREEIEVKG
ncbi:MAG: lysylphosphatidylglycerol synthase transmembrane domain-containing protein [bacterium]|nr:lysylphosphatidylglycerol synthase transmembrane domain-containing protein [bacterium]MDT8366577.1 lysylphosphatidylglycerol synthase transmembrane domain-containing protein [bacterium]